MECRSGSVTRRPDRRAILFGSWMIPKFYVLTVLGIICLCRMSEPLVRGGHPAAMERG